MGLRVRSALRVRDASHRTGGAAIVLAFVEVVAGEAAVRTLVVAAVDHGWRRADPPRASRQSFCPVQPASKTGEQYSECKEGQLSLCGTGH